jgi:protein-L-isoaspartate(D-aspartate) O-methyltransferase
VALEVDAGLCARLKENITALALTNVRVVEAPLSAGAAQEGPFDAILLNGAVEALDPRLLQQLKDGGRMVGVMASGPFGRAHVWRRSSDGFDTRPEFDAAAPPIPGFARPAGFVL